MADRTPTTPLLPGISQYEVDFVVPRLGMDLPLGIDPFLLYKSRDPVFSDLHDTLLKVFNLGVELVRERRVEEARRLLNFPEAHEIGLGYTRKGKRGAGVGVFISELIIETLLESPFVLQRGLRHVEELQLLSVGIGPDRVSDIAANIFKQHLISYTQTQAELWKLPLTGGVPVGHIFDQEALNWYDGYFDLPLSPLDNSPILLVPRRIVRTLPWINYDDFYRLEFSAYLRAKRVKEHLASSSSLTHLRKTDKDQVVAVARTELERVDRYINRKEADAADAQPSLGYTDSVGTCTEATRLKDRLVGLKPGTADAGSYQRVVLEILNFLFVPELIDGKLEVKTIDGTERRDILFTNDSDKSFWSYLRTEHSAFLLMFETKNTVDLDNIYFNQTATYLGDRIGRIGFIITRNPLGERPERKAFSIYNDSHPRKIILVLSDQDLNAMLDQKCRGEDTMRYIQRLYRRFRERVQ